MKTLITFTLLLLSLTLNAATELKLSTSIYDNTEEEVIGRETFLAMNVQDSEVHALKTQIEQALKLQLTQADPDAYVPVVTEKEFLEVLKSKFTMAELEKIADRYDLQKARLIILGVGSIKDLDFFLIVDSEELRTIRQMIHYEFVRRGGAREAFDPTWFFPHITIGTTLQAKNSHDTTLKNLKFSSDKRFNLKFIYGR